MTSNRTDTPHHAPLPRPEELLTGTDWASLETPCGTGEDLPGALARFLDTDPAVRAAAVGDALSAVTHQNTVYEATVPVALYVAAVLNHPATAAGESGRDGERTSRYPTRAALLDWLADTALDADDECVAIAEGTWDDGFLDECPEIRAFRDLRPAFHSAVRPLLGDDDADVRDAAFVAAVPLVEHPALVSHRGELAEHARRLLTTSTDRSRRDRALSALRTWGHDTSALENADDVAVRELRARRAAERQGWGTGGYSEDPPF
ncbi:hypothetical protein SUDANB105_01379 [Streptomyces sp. enrichment culture]|uniref:hypothetical protein n=1 Tax=Streptomyces sp. enrichment culture TaxID=1795815 RepID=UPI003F547708